MWNGFLRFFSVYDVPLVFPGFFHGHFLLDVSTRLAVNFCLLTFNYLLMKAVIVLINCSIYLFHYEG